MSSTHTFGIATIGNGQAVHLIAAGPNGPMATVCGVKGELNETTGEQDYWTCQRCEKSLARALAPEARKQLRQSVEIAQDEIAQDEAVEAREAAVEAAAEVEAPEAPEANTGTIGARKAIIKEYRLSKPMVRDLLGSIGIHVECHDGMTSKGLRARGVVIEGEGRDGMLTDEGLRVVRILRGVDW